MLRTYPAPRTHATAAGGDRRRGSRSSREKFHIPREIFRNRDDGDEGHRGDRGDVGDDSDVGNDGDRSDRGAIPRRSLMRTAGIMLAAGWLSGLPNPVKGTPVSQSSTPAPAAPAAPVASVASVASADPDTTTRFAVPLCLVEEHAELHTAFETAGRVSGETGAAARRIIALRAPHVEKEQRIAYPLLRLLPMIGTGPVEPWMTELLPLADRLRAALPELKREHVELLRAIQVLHTAAWAEGHPEYAFLAQRLKHHIRMEEEILYPAALVTAVYVRGQSR